AGRFEGILQPLADVLKLLSKELVIPKAVDRFFFILAPLLTVIIATAAVGVIPVTEKWVIARSDIGVLVIFAVLGFFPITALMAAWSSNSRYPLLGGLRALHQMVSYEIPLILSALAPVVYAGSLNLINIVKVQSSIWFILVAPISAIVFYICALAELERIPFDLPEAEPELVSGWLTEYGGMNFGLILGIAVYIKLYVLSALFTLLFLGGWLGPAFLPPEFWFILKSFIVTTLLLIPRGVFPRLRIDLLLKQSWARYLILALLNLIVAALVVLGGFNLT
ncbi:MAG: complex I subunit 1/NuoH family protein, partial [Nitrososphaerales archaeon]